jgi:hypothetical protein
MSFGSRWAFKVGICGIPHLAKNERDMGHPEIRGEDRWG